MTLDSILDIMCFVMAGENYLIVVGYEHDAERKRVENVFERWKGKVRVKKPRGLTFVLEDVRGEDVERLLEDLLSRTDREEVHVFRLRELPLKIERCRRTISVEILGDRESTLRLVNFLLARYKGVLKVDLPSERVYDVRTRKGKAEIRVKFKNSNTTMKLLFEISGYGEVVDYLFSKLSEEVEFLKET